MAMNILYFVQMLFILLVVPFKEALCVPLSNFTDAFPTLKTFQSQNIAHLGLRFVSDSGVCETTPGVHQMSGYITVGQNMSMVSGFSAKIDMVQPSWRAHPVVLVL